MPAGIGVIKAGFLDCLNSCSGFLKRFLFGKLRESDEQLLISMDGETCNLLAFAGQDSQSLEQAACSWLWLQAGEYKQGKELERCRTLLAGREQSVVALCCLAYSGREIATHLSNAIYKFGLSKRNRAPDPAEELGY